MEFKKLELGELHSLAHYFLKNRADIQKVIADFGEVEKDNGNGTIFLKPRHPLFKVFWMHCLNGMIVTIGIGGPDINLSFKELYKSFSMFTEGFSSYDERYIYVLYSSENYEYTVKVTSPERLLIDGVLIRDAAIKSLELTLR